MACSGDPLASHIYRPILHSYVGKATQTFTLFTNGLLIKKQLDKTALLGRITEFRISVDAGSELVYEKVRLGGKWKVLLENFDYLRDENLSQYVHLLFVVQKDNYQDISNFEKLCRTYQFRGTLSHLDDWGTWIDSDIETPDQWTIDHGTFAENNVLNHQHPEFDKCKKIIKSVQNTSLGLTTRLQEIIKE
jgi:MoaA/NifB/PqqE/SkfB family radical SAM enzyme